MILKTKTVAIVGVGGLGGFVAEYAARLNFKKIILIDGDTFNESNMNRQLLCTEYTLGSYKVDTYAAKIKAMSKSEVVAVREFFTKENADSIDGCDIVFDCLDNIDARHLLEKICSKKNIPIIHGAIGDNFGNACLCMPGNKMLEKLYKKKEELKVKTQAHSVAIIASIQMELAVKYFLDKYQNLTDKIIYVDLEDFEVKILPLR